MPHTTRRGFLAQCSAAMAAAAFGTRGVRADSLSRPNIDFPTAPRERIAVASYPFREYLSGVNSKGRPFFSKGGHPIDLKDFPALVVERFGIRKIEPWSRNFTSLDPKYIDEFRAALDKTGTTVVNIPADVDLNPYASDRAERERGIALNKKWMDIAVAIGSPSIRMNPPPVNAPWPGLERIVDSLTELVDYASSKNIVVNLENDDIRNSDPFAIVKIIEKVNSPWLHALPDFGNTLAAKPADYAYRGLNAMFEHAYCITHVKSSETNGKGITVHVDMAKAFGILKRNRYKGYCSMEWDDRGDPFVNTQELIQTTLRYL